MTPSTLPTHTLATIGRILGFVAALCAIAAIAVPFSDGYAYFEYARASDVVFTIGWLLLAVLSLVSLARPARELDVAVALLAACQVGFLISSPIEAVASGEEIAFETVFWGGTGLLLALTSGLVGLGLVRGPVETDPRIAAAIHGFVGDWPSRQSGGPAYQVPPSVPSAYSVQQPQPTGHGAKHAAAAPHATTSSPQAGWYEDPYDPAMVRYWDGSAWLSDCRPRYS